MRKVFLGILSLLLSYSLISCGGETDQSSKRRFHGDRAKMDKSGKRKRRRERKSSQSRKPPAPKAKQKASPAPQPKPTKDLQFPFALKTSHSALSIESVGDSPYKSSVSAEPADIPVKALAGLNGNLSIQNIEGTHTMIVSSNQKKLYFELDKEKTKLLAKDGQEVIKAQALAETTGPVIFYVKKGETLTALCFSVDQSSVKGDLVISNNFKYHPDCN